MNYPLVGELWGAFEDHLVWLTAGLLIISLI
jgi:hypothetical protein